MVFLFILFVNLGRPLRGFSRRISFLIPLACRLASHVSPISEPSEEEKR